MPQKAKVAVTLWIMSWLWLIISYYYLTHDSSWALKLAISVCLLGFFIFQAQNWARWISVLANVMGIFLSGYFFLAGFIMIATVNVILFSGGIYYFMVPITAQYFKTQSKQNHGRSEGPSSKAR